VSCYAATRMLGSADIAVVIAGITTKLLYVQDGADRLPYSLRRPAEEAFATTMPRCRPNVMVQLKIPLATAPTRLCMVLSTERTFCRFIPRCLGYNATIT
jgi:hypothetical protein